MKKELIAHRDPKSPVSEVFRTLRTNIQFMNTNNKLKTLLVTSTLPGEGKSWVTANLAVTFAQAGKKVVLVDADMRKGRQYTIFEVSPKPGLSNYLSGFDINTGEEISDDLADYIQDTQVKNLYIMSAGNIPPNPSELLISAKMINLLDRLKEICDIVIIDGTPCELVTDAIILSRIVDSTVIVTAHKQTKKDDLQKIVTNIQNVGGKIAGIVLNKIPVSVRKYEQSYYYGSTSMSKKGMKSKNARIASNMIPSFKRTRVEDMKKRVRPENPQAMRNSQARRNNTEIKNNQDMKRRMEQKVGTDVRNNKESVDLQRKLNVEKTEDISLDKTTEILNQINAYLDEEKKNLNSKKG